MKKIIMLASIALGVSVLPGCSFKDKLYILNWGDYMSEDMIEDFEDEFDVKVVYKTADSNESMYTLIDNETLPYDLVFPSDYMIEKLKTDNLIQKLDLTKLDNLSALGSYTDGLDDLLKECTYNDYFIPYFWGSLGIMYNTKNTELKTMIEENNWDVFFDSTLYNDYDVAMYDSSRDAFAAAQLYKGFDLNTTDKTELDECASVLKNNGYQFGTDTIKSRISTGNLDYGLVYSGDFFDQLWSDEGKTINYDIHVPTDSNNVFFDGVCIPVTSEETDLAYEFINFMLDFDNALDNAYEVGYTPVFQSVYKAICEDDEMEYATEFPAFHPMRINNGTVYKNLGATTYAYVETLFLDVKSNNSKK